MNKNVLKLPVLTVIGGIILRIVYFIAVIIMASNNNPNLEWFNYINLAASLIIIVIIGMILRRTYDKETFFKSATLLVIYSFILWGLSAILTLMNIGIYSVTVPLILSLPTEFFNIITSILREITSTQSIALIYLFGFIQNFAPYLFLLFAKNLESIKQSK